ncbi:oxidative stress survival, Svf1-like protein [Thamnocephalis sphaerospora]|uniref:Oxidative stress survival, Svf1-like protein n=1 Tax=Thamnocephalis sphaerospora TaxID=78915 RepID=A0A4P9XXE7_9FUNG|nr:oxidative stress survival, Svf1-like protein [Thamnocephalis sphaerospora]|eukprot:RKP11046.1 oxidative stress survival, Svf1-like protein [Thamnocephalis sphaerospora]
MPPTVDESTVTKASDLVDLAELAGELTADDLRWTTPPGSCSETQTVYLLTEDNALFFIQLAYANAGFGATVQTSFRYFHHPTKNNIFRTHSCYSSDFKLSSDRLSVNCKPISIQLNEARDEYTFLLEKGKERIRLQMKLVDRGYKLGKGRTYYGKDESASYVSHRWFPRNVCSGTAYVDGKEYSLKGHGTFIHAFSGMKPHLVASKWHMATFHSPRAAVNLIQFQTPPRHGSINVIQGSLVLDNKLLAVTVDNDVDVLDSELDPHTGYYPATHLRLRWRGRTLEDTPRALEISMEVHPTILCDRIDVLSELPWMVRKLVQALVAKPFVYEWHEPTKVQIRLDDELIEDDGHLLYECTFIS